MFFFIVAVILFILARFPSPTITTKTEIEENQEIVSISGSQVEKSFAASPIPTISILSVTSGVSVTIQLYNFPAGQTFVARMNKMGTQGIGGDVVGTIDTESGGSLTVSFDIPAHLEEDSQIAIRLDSVQGYYAFNWFYNSTPQINGEEEGVLNSYTGIPTMRIIDVIPSESVTIEAINLPSDMEFTVTMGKMYTRGIGGIRVGSMITQEGDNPLRKSFAIPEVLKCDGRISIRAQTAHANPFYAYNWFYNYSGQGPLITFEQPEELSYGRSDTIRISLSNMNDERSPCISNSAQDNNVAEGRQTNQATPLPIGTPVAPLNEAYGPQLTACAKVQLRGVGFEIESLEEESQCKSITGSDLLIWDWSITPKGEFNGDQKVIAVVKMEWTTTTDERVTFEESEIWRETMELETKKPIVTLGQINILTLISGLLGGSFFSAPFILDILKRREEKTREEQENKPRILKP